MKPSGDETESSNDFYYNGSEFGKGVHYRTLDYVPVSGFTPLSGTNWYRVNAIVGSPIVNGKRIDLNVSCIRCDNPTLTSNKVLRIEVISADRNMFRIRFNPYAAAFGDYDASENTFGPITRKQLDWIQQQDKTEPKVDYENGVLAITLKDVALTLSQACLMKVTHLKTGRLLHSDGWVKPNDISSASQPQGIVFVDEQYGSAVAAIKTLPTDNGSPTVRYYGCGECQGYYNTGDAQNNHSSSLEHTQQVMTFFNYDNYEMDQTELRPTNEPSSESPDEESFIPQYTGAPFFVEYAKDFTYGMGLLLDNTSQTYVNLGNKEYRGTWNPAQTDNIDNVYYFGAQYPELDYYLIFPENDRVSRGDGLIASVLDNYTLLMGKENINATALNLRGAMPPRYILGFFQGVYGFTGLTGGNWPVSDVVAGYQQAQIPLEGLAIDVDVQNDFEVFTTNGNFWEGGEVGKGDSVFQWAHKQNLVCQTNITNFIRNDQQNYGVFDALNSRELYTKCSKFIDFGNGPATEGTPYQAILPYTGTTAVFPNFGHPDTPSWWGQNYFDNTRTPYPLLEIGLDFVWQDMTVPAMGPHMLGQTVNQGQYNNSPGNPDLTGGQFNWKTYHGQLLYPDPRRPGQQLPYIAIRNLHAYMECKATYEKGLTVPEHLPTYFQRSYIISRGGYIGLGHFGGLWTGDNASGWRYMQIELPKVLNMGLCGFPVVGADLGGFAPDEDDDPQYNHCQEHLMTRWTQAGCLLPWFRDHYVNTNHGGKAFQELYKFNWDYNGRTFCDIMNDFVQLRVRLHRVLYDGMYHFCRSGLPPVKPTCLYEGGAAEQSVMKGFESCQDSQFFIGNSAIMVAPAMEDENCEATRSFPATIENHPVWFPAGRKWFAYDARTDGPCNPWDGFAPTAGSFGYVPGDGASHGVTVPLETLPLFFREGAIVPTRLTKDGSSKNIQQLDNDDEPFVFDIWPGSDRSEYICYFDDGGRTRDAETKGCHSLLKIQQSTAAGDWTIELSLLKSGYALPARLYIRLRGAEVGDVTDSHNNAYPRCDAWSQLFSHDGVGCYYYDTARREQWIQFSTKGLAELQITKSKLFQITALNP